MDSTCCRKLHTASRWDHHNCLRRLLNEGNPVNEPDWCGNTALHYASAYGYRRIIIMLLDHEEEANLYLLIWHQ